MVLLILESLGSTELLFILVMALVFFGPRKLPQLSRTMGKHLADFRRASEDFKHTWDREVTMEEFIDPITPTTTYPNSDSSLLDDKSFSQSLEPPTVEAIAADRVVPRQPSEPAALHASDESDFSSDTDFSAAADQAEPSRKRDWL